MTSRGWRNCTIRMDDATADRLCALARRERRHPRDQALVLLEQALARFDDDGAPVRTEEAGS